MAKTRRIYFFGNKKADGSAAMKNLLGGKGANLAEMTLLGVPVPPGFTITTETCIEYYQAGKQLPQALREEMRANLAHVEKIMKRGFGDGKNPLLVSVRSGARVSMPGMMDTILNLGLNDETVQGLAEESNNARFAYDSYRRFIHMYCNVVFGLHLEKFEEILREIKTKAGVKLDTDLNVEHLKDLVERYKKLVLKERGKPFPSDPWEQLEGAVSSVFDSWYNKRAVEYRRMYGIPAEWGTAANVQSMVFGNMGNDSATGVAFTRDPISGEDRIVGEYLINAQGEDVVAGIRTPQQITEEHRLREGSDLVSMEKSMPDTCREFAAICARLEAHYRYPQDLEFTVERGRLWLLQTRNAKRTARAGLRWAMDLHREPKAGGAKLSKEEVLAAVTPTDIESLFHPYIDETQAGDLSKRQLGKGLAGSPGAYSGQVVFDPDTAVEWQKEGKKVVLVRRETSPEDIHGMNAAVGFLTAVGGMTSHAVLVARQMNKACIAGVGEENLRVDYKEKTARIGSRQLKQGDWITIDGTSGKFYEGQVPTVPPKPDEYSKTFMKWASEMRRLRVRANADTPAQALQARELGAEGIGLCRTEHMFFEGGRLEVMRQMILNMKDPSRRSAALEKLLPLQRGDFKGILKAMEGLPVTIRLLDPPLHEFLPNANDLREQIWQMKASGKDASKLAESENLLHRVEALHELNPMLGHRGVRLAITIPEIYDMQVRAIIEAACELKKEGVNVHPEIMIPLVGHAKELVITRASAEAVAKKTQEAMGVKVDYTIGTMIEIPRAALTADEIAKHADFFSFGTNDLTQMSLGYSRDDIGKFLPAYLGGLTEAEAGRVQEPVLEIDPFVSIDQTGVGKLMKMAVSLGRETRPGLKIGICGEHGGEPASVIFCHNIGLDYVSCSPLRIPVAITAAAHAVLRDKAAKKAGPAAPVKEKKAAAPAKKASAKKAAAKRKSAPAKKASAKKAKPGRVTKVTKRPAAKKKAAPVKKAAKKGTGRGTGKGATSKRRR